MRLWGNADLRVNGPLGPFLDQVDDQARRNHMGEVVADFRELVFMNSSCLKEFVRWIAQVEERAEHYRIRFLSDPGRAVAVAQPAGAARVRARTSSRSKSRRPSGRGGRRGRAPLLRRFGAEDEHAEAVRGHLCRRHERGRPVYE